MSDNPGMTTLPLFLLARIAEDEAAADANRDPASPWAPQVVNGKNVVHQVADPLDDGRTAAVAATFGAKQTARRVATCHSYITAEHIARQDPARVLAECDAKRRILSVLTAWEPDPACQEEAETPEHDAWRMLTYLALPYSEHPDYRDEWRP